MFSLYGDLPAPKAKNDNESTSSNTPSNITTQAGDSSAAGQATSAAKTTTTGWSNIQQFRPVMRKPTIQAKPKLFKPTIPSGATILSTTTVKKEDNNAKTNQPISSSQEIQPTTVNVALPSASNSSAPSHTNTTILPLQTRPYWSATDDVNGFRQQKKKGKQNKQAAQNQGPPPIDFFEDYDPLKPTDYEQYKEEIEIIKQQERKQKDRESHHFSRHSSYSSSDSSRSRSPSPRRPARSYAPPPELCASSSSSSSASRRQHQHQHQHQLQHHRHHHQRSRSPSLSRNSARDRSLSPSSRHSAKEQVRLSAPSATVHAPERMNLHETGDDAYSRRVMLSQKQARSLEGDMTNSANVGNMAWKVMNKYGWQEGQGLGRTQDGIREALQVQARGDGSGVILPQRHTDTVQHQQKPGYQVPPTVLSRVIVLKNMVGPGEVDDLLEQETADECAKYGQVEQCLIYEVPDGQVSDEEAVRIFVKFAAIPSAVQAIGDMNNRYFDGRVVSAEMYDQDRFEKLDLAPLPHQFRK